MGTLRVCWPAAALLMLACSAGAQDLVEYTAGTAKATAATGMKGVGKGAGAALEKAIKTLDKAVPTGSSGSTSAVVLTSKAGKSEPAVKLTSPDPALIAVGMTPDELVRKFGEPAMKASGTKESDAGETWWYGSGTDTVTITLLDGKVRSVSPQARPTPTPAKADTAQANTKPAGEKSDSSVPVKP